MGGFQRSVSGVVLIVMCRKRMNDIREESEAAKHISFSYKSFFIGCYGTYYIIRFDKICGLSVWASVFGVWRIIQI